MRFLLVLIFVAGVAAPTLARAGCDDASSVGPSSRVTTMTIDASGGSAAGSAINTLRVLSSTTITLRSAVSDRIRAVNVKRGAKVASGEVLYVLDPAPFEARVASAKAALDQANSAVVSTALVIALQGEESDSTRAKEKQAAAEVDARTAELDAATRDLAATTVRSPADGVIGEPLADAGEMVMAGTSSLGTLTAVMPGALNICISDKGRVRFFLDESGSAREVPRPLMLGTADGNTVTFAAQAMPGASGIQDLNQFIDLAIKYPAFDVDTVTAAYRARAGALVADGQLDAALNDLDRAVTAKPKSIDAVFDRATLRLQRGEFALAVADDRKIVELAPRLQIARYWLANANFLAGQYDDAAAGYLDFLARVPQADAALRLHIARLKAGHADYNLLEIAGKFDRGLWPVPMIDLMLGRASMTAIRERIAHDDASKQKSELCDLDFYGGSYERENGDAPAAQALFEGALVNCGAADFARQASQAELDAGSIFGWLWRRPGPSMNALNPAVWPLKVQLIGAFGLIIGLAALLRILMPKRFAAAFARAAKSATVPHTDLPQPPSVVPTAAVKETPKRFGGSEKRTLRATAGAVPLLLVGAAGAIVFVRDIFHLWSDAGAPNVGALQSALSDATRGFAYGVTAYDAALLLLFLPGAILILLNRPIGRVWGSVAAAIACLFMLYLMIEKGFDLSGDLGPLVVIAIGMAVLWALNPRRAG